MSALACVSDATPDYDVLGSLAAYWDEVMAGEVQTAKLLFLVGTSCLLDKPMHAILKGPSSAGKSEVRKQVLRFFPPDRVIALTAMSEHALLGAIGGDLSHRILSMAEAEATRDRRFQDYLLRELMSEGKLIYRRHGVGNITIDGPVSFLLTTTRDRLHPENETRMLTLRVDDTEAQTRRVLHRMAQSDDDPIAGIYPGFHVFHRMLADKLNYSDGITGIDVPFGKVLASTVPTKSLRVRRDFGQLLTAIKTHALLQHEHRTIKRGGVVAADLTDYAVVRELMSETFATSALTKTIKETIAAVRALQPHAMVIDVAQHLRINKSSASRRLQEAQAAGYITNAETRAGYPAKFNVDDDALNPLPSPTKVAAAWK
jgi:hypothetical protein